VVDNSVVLPLGHWVLPSSVEDVAAGLGGGAGACSGRTVPFVLEPGLAVASALLPVVGGGGR
jgi:hypothetical protein